ncbi:MAG: FixG Ig-like domain-containing protein, partial [Erythrobacter sp.]
IDACDRVMKEVGRPRGLIDYATLEQCEAEAAGAPAKPAWKALLRFRTFVYLGVWSAIGAGLLFALGTRTHTGLTVAPDRNPPFMLLKDGSVRNAYTLRLRNMEARPRAMTLVVEGLPQGAVMWTEAVSLENAAQSQAVTVPANATRVMRAYVMLPAAIQREGADKDEDDLHFAFRLTSNDEQNETARVETTFAMPGDD